MNILYAVNSGNPGGVEYHVLDLVRGLYAKGHKLFVWCVEGPVANDYRRAGATVIAHKIGFEVDLFYIFALAQFIRKNDINVVHAHELKAGFNAMLGARLGGARCIITNIHTPMSEWQVPNLLKKIYTRIEMFFYSFAVNLFSTYEVALTPSRRVLKQQEGIAEKKLVVIPNGINVEELTVDDKSRVEFGKEIRKKYAIAEDAFVIGCVGRLTEEKGHQVALEAFAKLRKTAKNAPMHMLFAGGGRLEDKLKAEAKRLGIEPDVTFSGIFTSADRIKFYSTFDAFIFPTLAEGFGLVMLEAMVSGLPVVASDLPVLREIGSDDVVYFQPGNAEDLAKKLAEVVVTSEEYRKTLGAKLREHVVQKYSMLTFVDSYQKLYESSITG